MALTTRQKLYFFAGLNMAIYGLALTILGAWSINTVIHGASGAPMWIGIVLIMCGVADVIISLDVDEKRVGEVVPDSVTAGSMAVNMIAGIAGALVIGFATWGAWNVIDRGVIYRVTEPAIEIYATVVLIGTCTLILALLTLAFDCCSTSLASPATIPAPAPVPYFNNAAFAYPNFQ